MMKEIKEGLSVDDRREVAKHLMKWTNMVFAGLVIAQALFDKFNAPVALAGVGLFVIGY